MNAIRGRVHNPDATITQIDGEIVLLDPTNPAQRLYSAGVERDGHYNLQGINSGSYLLFCAVWGADERFYWEIPVSLGENESIHIDLLADTAQVLT